MWWQAEHKRHETKHNETLNMALAEVCGLNSFVNFKKSSENEDVECEIDVANFCNNLQLAVPPYANVSK